MHLIPEKLVNLSAAAIEQISLPQLHEQNVFIDVLRLDKIDAVISGNKWFKLRYYLEEAISENRERLITFGGAWSNHILATACLANKAGMKSTGIIRGEKPVHLSSTLARAAAYGMELQFIDRITYNQKNDPSFIQRIGGGVQESLVIPEGGDGEQGVRGAATIGALVSMEKYTHIICAMGTGTMVAGMAKASAQGRQLIGIPVLKGFADWTSLYLNDEQRARITIITGYEWGGYAKKNETLIGFMNDWYLATGIPTDFVYTGKLMFAVQDLIQKRYFPSESRLLVVHSGGLQGNDSLPPGTLVF